MDQEYRLEKNSKYGFQQITPTPSSDVIERYYKEEFYASAYPTYNDSSFDAIDRDKAFFEAHYSDIVAGVEEVLESPIAGKKVLDVGCGWCHALEYLQGRGISGFGFDPAEEAVARGKELGLKVQQAGMGSMKVFEERFEVVTMLNVLEHLSDPVGAIKQIRSDVIADGGVLVIDVPNEFNLFQTSGQAVHGLPQWWVAPPAHLNYFDAPSLRALLEGNGFAVKILEASFPLEIFLLMGEKYVGNPELGRQCHEKRMAFEENLRATGGDSALRQFYRALAMAGVGRQIMAFAKAI
jgi:2-polyprenyl-3-methyl-5-hydroxy-6-metoxy-1,4-benzoquinol methylase